MGFDVSPFLAFGGALAAAIVACFGTVKVASSRVKVDLSAQVAAGVESLLKTLQEERSQLSEIIKRQREELAASDRLAVEIELIVRRQRRRIALLEDKLDAAQIPIPTEQGG